MRPENLLAAAVGAALAALSAITAAQAPPLQCGSLQSAAPLSASPQFATPQSASPQSASQQSAPQQWTAPQSQSTALRSASPQAATAPQTSSPQSTSPGPARPVFVNGQAQVVPAFEDPEQWIRETLWVETEFDSDGDGKRDRVFVGVTRPRQTETEGLKVPVVYESSPYFAGTSGPREYLWDVRQEVGAEPPPRTSQPGVAFRPERPFVSNSQVNTWLPRGFAVVHSDAPGTGLSEGCVTVGGPPEILAPKAVIDWLNGRAKGFTTIDGTEEVTATSWSTGRVGMTGTSYNGTIPVAAATTGVKGLEAIIPIAPNTSYYHYYRSHGLVRHPGGWLGEDIDFLYDFVNSGNPARREACNARYRDGEFARGRDRASGDYNDFWESRDLLPKAKRIKAAVLMSHAFNDWNVVPEHSVRFVNALKGRVPLQVYYHQGGHGGAPPLEMMNKWFTRYLYGVRNGVEQEPKAWIVRETKPEPPPAPLAAASGATPPPAARGRARTPPPPPTPYADYPNPEASMVTLRPRAGGREMGGLNLQAAREQDSETLVDNVEMSGADLAKAAQSPHRLLYATPVLSEPLHISGTARVTVRLASSKPAANLSVWLVVLPWTDGPIGPANLITRGWADPQNHRSLKKGGDYHSKDRGRPLVPGQFCTLTFDLQPDDQVVPAGKRIGLMIFSSDRDFTLWPAPGTELTFDLEETMLRLPVVGGEAQFRRATSGPAPGQAPAAASSYPDGLYAELHTDKGLIVLRLEYEKTPVAVMSFVGLAEGTIDNKALPPGTRYFDGTVFHRVVPGHVIQAGRPPKGGGPGYTFPNEIAPGLGHGRAGMLGMANSGPHTNGSQFYITLGDRSYLDGNYTVFGEVVSGLDVVNSIVQGDGVESVRIVRVGEAASAFKADTASFKSLTDKAWAAVKAAEEKKEREEGAIVAKNWPAAKTSAKGALFVVRQEGEGSPAQPGQTIAARYTGRFLDGSPFASTADEGRPAPGTSAGIFEFIAGKTRVTPAVDEALLEMLPGERRTIIARGALAYGNAAFYSRERPGEKRFVISTGTTLVYELEVISIR